MVGWTDLDTTSSGPTIPCYRPLLKSSTRKTNRNIFVQQIISLDLILSASKSLFEYLSTDYLHTQIDYHIILAPANWPATRVTE